jgi:histidinol-phosphate aminotransferase
VIATREQFVIDLQALDFQVLPSSANFVFARPPSGKAEALYLALKQEGILVRHFKKPRIHEYLRISIGTDAEMQALVAKLKLLLAKQA